MKDIKPFALRLDPIIYEKLKEAAKVQRRSINSLINVILEVVLDKVEELEKGE